MENKAVGRKAYLDFLRGLAAIGVVLIHVSANNWYGYVGSADWITFSVYHGIFKAVVPIFFMISDCLMLDDHRERSVKDLYFKYIKRLVIFLIFWAVVYKAVQLALGDGSQTVGALVKQGITEILLGKTQSHLWYIYATIGLYIFTPALKTFANNSTRKQLLYTIICLVILGSFCELFEKINHLHTFTNNAGKIKSGIGFGYIGYYLVGYYIDKFKVEKGKRIAIYLLGVIGLVATIYAVISDSMNSQAPVERFWEYKMPGVMVFAVAVFLFARNMNFKNNIPEKLLNVIAKNSLGIYGCHFLYIILFWKNNFTTFSFNGILSVPVISFMVLVLSLITASILKRIPVMGKYIA